MAGRHRLNAPALSHSHSSGEHPASAECGVSKSINRRLVRQFPCHELISGLGNLKPGLESFKRTPVFQSSVSILL